MEKKTALRPILVYMHALVYILKIAVGAPIQNLTYKTLCPYFFYEFSGHMFWKNRVWFWELD